LRGGAIYIDTVSTNPQSIVNTTFSLNTADNYGGAVFIVNNPISFTNCTFIENLANSGLGNDIYLNQTVTYSTSYIVGCCSDSEQPRVNTATINVSSLLGACVPLADAYIADAMNTPAGSDANGVKVVVVVVVVVILVVVVIVRVVMVVVAVMFVL
jgi:hypothetical protein